LEEKTIIIIPAREESSRLSRKLFLPLINEEPIIVNVYKRAKKVKNVDKVIVACDSENFKEFLDKYNVESVITPKDLPSGSDRVFYAYKNFFSEYSLIVNLQGDEVLFPINAVEKVINIMKKDKKISIATIGTFFDSYQEFIDPNNVKIVLDNNNYALYFSRSPIPYNRDNPKDYKNAVKHIGIYFYRPRFLGDFINLSDKSSLEKIEKLEQLRLLEFGYKIFVEVGKYFSLSIDTENDYKKAQKLLNKDKKLWEE